MEGTRKSVLIVEHDRTVRDVLPRLVSRMGVGYEMIGVERASRAVSVLSERQVEAMLLDLHMPGPHGYDLLRFPQKHIVSALPHYRGFRIPQQRFHLFADRSRRVRNHR